MLKALTRRAVVAWREQPTQYDLEAIRANVERVGLVIRMRWALVVALAVFSVVGASIYATSVDIDVFLKNMVVPAIALAFVVAYNTFYQLTYRRLGNLAFLNEAQLLFDMVVITALVYYSGGVDSWFSTMYLLVILEATFILPSRTQVFSLVVVAAVLYALVLFGEYAGWLPHVTMPFVHNDLHTNLTFVLVRYLWKVTLFGGAASVGTLMMRTIRKREQELRESSFVDDLTGLFNRQYFHRVLTSEVERARRTGRTLALLLVDVDHLGEVNRTFGMDVGDALLASIASALRGVAHTDSAEAVYEVNVPCRVGGEELALIIPEVARSTDDETPIEDRALAIAEGLREDIERVRVNDVGVTASIGLALLPRDGETPDALLDAADRMLARAAQRGGNVVCATWLCGDEPDDEA